MTNNCRIGTRQRHHDTMSVIIANTASFPTPARYYYITSMGYAILPFLEKTEILLYPCIALLLVTVLSIFLRINLTVWFVYMICGG